jgi:hypothetical protein
MNKIVINEIHLLNFKGIRQLDIAFDERSTVISGTNGVGKSTVFDAFCWVLFGKNAADRKDFSIKTNGEDGLPIPRLPHEVTAVMTVGDERVTLKRCYSEKWTKRRGESAETFSGHTEERYYNDVPCSVAEYDKKVRDICSEEVFKFITCPGYFPTRKEDQMRRMLFEMAGDVADRDVAGTDKDFNDLLDSLTGKTMEEYKKEIQAKKNRIQASLVTIPGRIDERKRDLLDPEDTSTHEEELVKIKKEHERTLAQIKDKEAAYTAASEKRMEQMKKVQELKEFRMKREGDIRTKVLSGYRNAIGLKRKAESDLASAKAALARTKLRLEDQQSLLDRYNVERAALLDEWKQITAEIKKGMAPDSMMDESLFVCPTCGRRYEMDEIENRQKEITERYLKGKLEEKERNQQKGLALKAKMRTVQDEVSRLSTELGNEASKVAALQAVPELTVEMEEPDPTDDVCKDEKIIRLNGEIAKLEDGIERPVVAEDVDTLNARSADEQRRISELQDFISRQERIVIDNRNSNERIAELEKELRALNVEKARLEGIEFTMQSFSKARTRAIEHNVNSMFKKVRFKLFDTLVNGAEVECCVPMVDGVPYSDANTAGKVNAGLDIINTVVRRHGISAPIFIDGFESINSLEPVDSQLVLLEVTDEEHLTVRPQGEMKEQ